MAAKRKSPQQQGIESRTGGDGKTRYRAEVRIPGDPNRKRIRGKWRPNLAEARADRVRLLAAKERGALVPTTSTLPTVREAGEAWLDQAREGRAWTRSGDRYAPKTLRGYDDSFRAHVFPAFGDVPVDQLKRSRVQLLVDEVAAELSGQTARNTITPLSALYRYLMARHDDLSSPTIGLQLPRGSKPRERIATPDELRQLIDALPEADRAAFATAGIAGLRNGELRALRVEDVKLGAEHAPVPEAVGRITVRWNLDRVEGVKVPKSDAGARDVPVFAPLLPHLERQARSLGPDPDPAAPFFPARGRWGDMIGSGVPFDANELLRRAYREWTAAGLPRLLLHEARHTFASHLIAAGYDVATVAEWVGHARPSFTLDRYVKPLRSRGISREMVAGYLGVGA